MKNFRVFFVLAAFAMLAGFQNCGKYNFAAVTPGTNGTNGTNNVVCGDVNNPCPTGSPGAGGPGDTIQSVTQTFPYDATPSNVDILVIDDNSGSMKVEQANLGSKFSNLISNLSGLNYQIAVTSTDVCMPGSTDQLCNSGSNVAPADGQFFGQLGMGSTYSPNYIITSGTNNAATVFSNTVQRDTQTGSGDERPIYATNLVIDNHASYAPGFIRANSIFAVLILSDEDERSVGAYSAATGDNQYRPLESYDMPQTLVNKMATVFPGKPFLVNAIDIVPGDTNLYTDPKDNTMKTCDAVNGYNNNWHDGRIHQGIVSATHGIQASICQTDFSASLNNISTMIQQQQTSLTITLAYIPNAMPTVTFNPAANVVTYTWNVGTNTITLGSRPAPGTTVSVSYTYDPAKQ